MSLSDRFARLGDRVSDRLRVAEAFSVDPDQAQFGDLESLRTHEYALLVTFRRNGEGVPSPVWFGMDSGGSVFVQSRPDSGKVKRLRRDQRVLLAPSSARGKPLGAAVRGIARVLPEEDWDRAETIIASRYGLQRRISNRLLDTGSSAYLEIAAARAPSCPCTHQ